jgi:antitoxin StbD
MELILESLFATITVSMSDFKKNPAAILRQAGGRPVAVLNHNRAAFYMVEPGLFRQMSEKLAASPKQESAWQRGEADRRRVTGVLAGALGS